MRPTQELDTRSTGARYEDIALSHLQAAGLTLITRNFLCRLGEIDLIMRERDVVVFVEVRYRRGADLGMFGDGIDSISASKRTKLIRAAGMFLAQNPRMGNQPCRFDVIAIAGDMEAPRLDWRPNAFESH